MQADYSVKGKVMFHMDEYVARLLEEARDGMEGEAVSPAA